jgi:hypothetical protein
MIEVAENEVGDQSVGNFSSAAVIEKNFIGFHMRPLRDSQ